MTAEKSVQAICEDPVSALLPFYLNGSLEKGEEEEVRAHTARCAVCARELDELTELAEGVREHGVRVLGDREPERAAHPRLTLALAAAGLVVGLVALGLGWRALSLVPAAARPEVPGPTYEIDLGGGPSRGTSSPPAFRLPRSGETFVIRFAVPPSRDAVHRIELRGPEGIVASGAEEPLEFDLLGRSTFEVPPAGALAPGGYELVVQARDDSGRRDTYRFPFSLRSPASGEP